MNVYKLMYDYEHYDNLGVQVRINDEHLGFNRYDAESGAPLHINRIVCDECMVNDSYMDYIPNDQGWTIVSKKAKDILMSYVKETEFIPIVRSETKEEIGFLLNPLTVVANAIDTEHSVIKRTTYSTDDGIHEHVMYIKIALKACKIRDYNIFRIAENPMSIFVSETLKREIIQNCAKGFDFSKIRIVDS